MATKAQVLKSKQSLVRPKYTTRVVRRCWRCGRRHGYMRDFDICRICFRELANNGELPGIRKASW
ncbi:type Z 30S ribosomal protein S14 [Candidatus Uhrbacteria bacterium]|nr:type Z 30S ribosomal protein S14 [Candidatus Uhrbacteria bacterium]